MKMIKKLLKWWGRDPMTEQKAIVSLIIYFKEGPKGFIGSLITAFFKADPDNFAKLSNEWPMLGKVILKYLTVDGYSKEHGINQD